MSLDLIDEDDLDVLNDLIQIGDPSQTPIIPVEPKLTKRQKKRARQAKQK